MFTITSSATFGIKAVPISVETDIASGLPAFTIVGLPDTSVRESRDRIRSAIRNSRFSFPRGRVTVNLAPAHLRKQGVIYDLPIALSLLIGMGKLSEDRLVGSVFLGELGLHGEVRSVPGVLPSALMAKRTDRPNVFVPKGNAPEAALIEGVRVFGVSTLLELVDYLNGEREISPEAPGRPRDDPPNAPCFSTIRGHAFAKRGLEIAAAGRHNVLLQGPPGTGKTLLARSFPSLLPALTHEEAIEVASIASVAGVWAMSGTLPRERPFRAPHHSCSAISLIGGGTWPAPGEVSLAHHGVLFLDELPEFGRHTLETLRQ
ncbi:YifB family Mg chelatase-like AAA ATPase, partial [Candidatus Parcubacteria bacterium]|nr:YifB family Mg chelatase-like AAA ATPase [Candidatus Parcubacteria bacterium]